MAVGRLGHFTFNNFKRTARTSQPTPDASLAHNNPFNSIKPQI